MQSGHRSCPPASGGPLAPQVYGCPTSDSRPLGSFSNERPGGPAAALAGVSRQAVEGWLAHGWLHAQQTDDGVRLETDELRAFLARRAVAQTAGIRLATLARWIDADVAAD
jgi:hypothetical protein